MLVLQVYADIHLSCSSLQSALYCSHPKNRYGCSFCLSHWAIVTVINTTSLRQLFSLIFFPPLCIPSLFVESPLGVVCKIMLLLKVLFYCLSQSHRQSAILNFNTDNRWARLAVPVSASLVSFSHCLLSIQFASRFF